MNPFSAFLQPPTQRSPLEGAGEFIQGMSRMDFARQQEANRLKEAALDNTRADSQLKLQQDYQSHTFSEADQKKLMALTDAYKQAEDQGDPILMSRALQDLKAFGGADVRQGMDPRAAALTGGKPARLPGQLLPDVKGLDPRAAAFTGAKPGDPNPTGDAISTELATRDKLRNRTEEPDLSQEDFESQLISGSGKLPERMEQGGATTEAAKAQLGTGQPEDLGDVDSPEFQKAAQNEVVDLDKEDPRPLQIGGLPQVEKRTEAPQAAGAQVPKALPGQLPTVISKGGKTIYESTGPSGRWGPMVEGVFAPAASHPDPEIAQAGKRAQAMARSLIAVDGISPEKAIKIAKDDFDNAYRQIIDMRQTELGSKPRGGGGAAAPASGWATGAMGTAQRGLTDDAWKAVSETSALFGIKNLNVTDNGLANASAGLNSTNPASQRGAIRNILKAMSGLTVNAKEEAGYERIAGLAEQARNMLAQLTGDEMSPEYISAVRQMLGEWRAESQKIRTMASQAGANAYRAFATQAPPDIIEKQAQGIRDILMSGGGNIAVGGAVQPAGTKSISHLWE